MYLSITIEENAEQIRDLVVFDHPVPFEIERWRAHIPDIDIILVGFEDGAITRGDLFSIFPEDPTHLVPCTLQRQAGLRRFFILVMIWGYGVKDNRGPWRVGQMIASPGFPKILCKVSEECFYGHFLLAFHTLIANIDRLGPAFASKYLYFYCQNFNASVKPLIFDNLIVSAMRGFDWPDWCADYMAGPRDPKRTEKAYGQYLITMHNWAKAINCRPDQLEYFLWGRASGLF
jgi:hypothetical protein